VPQAWHDNVHSPASSGNGGRGVSGIMTRRTFSLGFGTTQGGVYGVAACIEPPMYAARPPRPLASHLGVGSPQGSSTLGGLRAPAGTGVCPV
jgi:hypothetical protein